jgi:hypothetical protein
MSPTANAGILYHPQLGECSYSLRSVSDDPDTQVSQVVGMMNDYVMGDAGCQVIAADCSACRQTGEPILDTWNYLSRYGGSRGMQFQRDEITAAPIEQSLPRWQPVVEALIRPADLAMMPTPMGDCDDFASYGAAHLVCAGVPCSFVTIAADPSYPGIFSHVYLVAYPQSGMYAGYRVPMDLSHGQSVGWEHPGAFRLKEWPLAAGLSILQGAGIAAGLLGAYLLYGAARRSN